jgi:hypothetical protein
LNRKNRQAASYDPAIDSLFQRIVSDVSLYGHSGGAPWFEGIAAALITNPLARPVIQTKGYPATPAFGNGALPYGWRPKAHAAQAEDFSDRMFSLWTIGDDGLVEVIGFRLSQEAENKHYPGWFSLAVAQVLLMAEKLRLRAGRPDVPLAIDAQFQHDGTAFYARPGISLVLISRRTGRKS